MAKQTNKRVETVPDETPRQPDRLTEALRDIPRLRSIEEESGGKRKYLGPPPPTVSRIGGLAQGCGGVLLTVLAVLMSMVALWFGYYLWGPALLLAGGVLLVAATVGVWRGRRLAVIVSAVILITLGAIAAMWYSFIPAAGALAPIGGVNVFFGPVTLLVILVLVIALVTHLLGLGLYWRRLVAPLPRSFIFWIVGVLVLVVVAVGLHVTQQSQRATWFDDRLDEWTAEAASDTPLLLGSNTNVTLGYSFLTTNEDDDDRSDLRLAELSAALDSGAELVRVSASGDVLFEQETPRLFKVDDPSDSEAVAEAAARLDRQQAREAEYMQRIEEAETNLYLADSQYTPYLLVWAADDDAEDVTWETFAEVQAQRVRTYAEQYQPYAYEIVNEPEAYFQYSGITLPDGADDAEKLDLWIAQTERLIQEVNEVSPETLVGIAVNLGSALDKDYYERAIAVEGLDFVGFRVFQPAAFDEIEKLYEERGHPGDNGKQGWIVETWYGYCLAPQRSMEFDARWLETTVAFAQKERMSAVLESDFGCFLEPGGTLFQTDVALDGRTAVWESWRNLIAQQAPNGD